MISHESNSSTTPITSVPVPVSLPQRIQPPSLSQPLNSIVVGQFPCYIALKSKHLMPLRMAHIKKSGGVVVCGVVVVRKEPLTTVVGNVVWIDLCGKQCKDISETGIELPTDQQLHF